MTRTHTYPTASLTVIDILTTLSRGYTGRVSGIRRVIDRGVARARGDQAIHDVPWSQPQPIVVDQNTRGVVGVELREKGVCRAGLRFSVRGPHLPASPAVDEMPRGSLTQLRWDIDTVTDLRVRFLLTHSDVRDGMVRRPALTQPLAVLPEAALRLMLDTCGHRRGLTVAVALGQPVAELDVSAWSAAAPWIRCLAKTQRAHVLVRATRIQVYDFGARAPRHHERRLRHEELVLPHASA